MKNLRLLMLLWLCCLTHSAMAQVYSNKVVGKKNEDLKDSLATAEYPYILPIWGKKATQKGFQLPYSAGLGINYVWQESELIIDNLEVGFNHGPKHNIDEIVRIDEAIATANAVNIRPDIWLFPFLNVYGILARAKTSTEINAGVFLPDSSGNMNQITSFNTKAEFDATSFGLGFTPTIGIGNGWMALDMNVAWTDVDALDKPVFTFIFGPRFGKTFKFKKEQNIAIWAGGFRVKFSSETDGSINLGDIFSTEELEAKVNEGNANLDAYHTQVETWWNGLSSLEQNKPSNIAKYETANRMMEAAGKVLTGLEGAITTAETSTVQYSLDKNLKDKWNFIVGSQYQLNRHFMIRGEFGFLGSRQQFIGGLQYRFGL
jgi:hypothetical protein